MEPRQPANPQASTARRLRLLAYLVGTGIALYLCWQLAVPFLPPLVWAGSLALLFTPVAAWLERRIQRRSLATLVAVIGIGSLVVIPAAFVGQRLILQATEGARSIEARVESGDWRRMLESQPRIAPLARRVEEHIDLPGLARSLTSWLTTTAGSLVRGSFLQAVDFCLTFYLLFFFLRDRAAAIALFRSASPLSDAGTTRVLSRISETIHAGVYGTLAVATAQGLLGGLMFWWLGLPAPLLWGVVMGILAVLPVLGAFVVWIPATLYLALEGNWGKAAILTAWGILVVGTIDNLLRPVLVGNRLKLHTVVAFMSVVGGILFFGPVGVLLGPVILTLTISFLEEWPRRGSTDLPSFTVPAPTPRLTPSCPPPDPAALDSFETDGGPSRR